MGKDERLFVTRGHEYEVEVYSPSGERAMTIRREYSRFPPSERERRYAQEWIENVAENYYASIKDRLLREYEIADPKRATAALFVSDDGYLWVRTYTEHDMGSYTWDVYDLDGRFLTSVVTPSAIYVYRIVGNLIYAVWWTDDSVPYIKRYLIRRPVR